MLIPNKHNGYQAGIRRLHIDGGGGGGGGGGEPVVTPPPARLPTAAPPPRFTTYGQGDRTGSLVQSGNSWRPSTLDYSRPIYDPNYADNITGYQDSSQFNQPIYQQQSANYTNPLTAFNVSNYGTNPGMSKSMQQASAPGGMGAGAYYQELQNYGTPNSRIRNVEPGGINFSNLVQDMRRYNMSGQDFQNASSYTPPQSNYGGGRYRTQQYVDPDTGRATGLADIPQMNWQTGQMTQPMQQQMQTPFSYQQPMQQQYQPQQMQQPMAQPNYGPSQAIVGRSSQMRGTPNVMRRAEGGIASLLDNDE
jgi:hypothetical protein